MYGNPYGGASVPYAPPPVGVPPMPYSDTNSPQDTSRFTYKVGASTSYSGYPAH
jgi:hypothetical protein